MKIRRILFCSIAGICLIMGLLTGIRELYLVFFIMLILIVSTAAMSIVTAMKFCYVQKLEKEKYVKGDTVKLSIRIVNEMPFPFALMRIRVDTVLPDGEEHTFSLSPGEEFSACEEILCEYRGVYMVGMHNLEITDVFGLFPMKFDLLRLPYYRQERLLVLPRVNVLNTLSSYSENAKIYDGTNLSITENGGDFASVRDYRDGDSEKRIHWKAYARTGKLYTRQYELSVDPNCIIYLDTKLSGLEGEKRYIAADIICESAATVVYYFLRQDFSVRLQTPGNEIKCENPAEIENIQIILAELQFGDDESVVTNILSDTEKSFSRFGVGNVFVFSASVDETLREAVSKISVYGNVTLVSVELGDSPEAGAVGGARVIHLHWGDDIAKRLGEVLK